MKQFFFTYGDWASYRCRSDVFEISNINRQMLATSRVIGKAKAKVAEEVVTDIHPYLSTNFLQKG